MLEKKSIPIPLGGGLDRKSDPWQIPLGRFYALRNCVFTKEGRLTKRNGYKQLTALPGLKALATFQGGLVGIGSSSLSAYSSSTQQWSNRGTYQPLSLSTASLVRSANTEQQCDVAVASNGLTCAVYTELASGTSTAKYAVFDSTGNAVVSPTTISSQLFSSTSHCPRVFVLANYFVIVFAATISATLHLQYIAIPIVNPASPIGPIDITTDYAANGTSAQAFDGVVAGGQLYVAWNTAASGIKVTYFDAALNQYTTTNPDAAHQATHLSVTADTSGTTAIWVTYYSSSTQNGYTLAVNATLGSVLGATQVLTLTAAANVTSVATGGVNTILFEFSNTYLYGGFNNYAANFIQKVTVTQAGTVASGGNFARGVGLGSKAFLVGGNLYVLASYLSVNQSTYFLLNASGQVVGKLAYQSGAGYLTLGLPSAFVNGTSATVGYLNIFQITPVSKAPFATTNGVYAQAGVNAATWNFSATPTSAELGGALHISGGQLWMFDGTNVAEHGFHLFPELNAGAAGGTTSVSALWYATTITTSATTSNGSPVLTAVGNTNLLPGTPITGTGIPANTFVTGVISSNSISISQAATASGTVTVTLGYAGGSMRAQPDGSTNTNAYYYQYYYQWTDAQGNIHRSAPSLPIPITTSGTGSTGFTILNIPVLRMTLKSNVQIVITRWSVAQQIPYQVTSVSLPLYNDPNANFPYNTGVGSPNPDIVSYVDAVADSGITGNAYLYTFGGTLENNASPPTNVVSVFDSRLWVLDAEYPNRFSFSQPVIQGTPVEMSSLLTYYAAPTLGAQGAPGNVTAAAKMDEKFVFHKANAAIFYLTGTGPDATGANSQYSQPIPIETPASAINAQLGIFDGGHLFQSDKGIWALLRNLSVVYQGAPVEDFTSKTVVSALTIPNTTQVRVALSDGTLLMYDYFRGQWGSFKGLNAGSGGTLFQGLHTYLDSQGRVFQETPGSYLDEGGSPVLISFITPWINPAGLQGYQRAYNLFLLGQYLSPHTLTVGIAYDRNSSIQQLAPIAPDNYAGTWGSDTTWGSGAGYGGAADTEQWQINFKQQQCQSFQVTVTEQFDSSKGVVAGAGLNLSGLLLVAGMKKGYPKNLPAGRKTG